MTKRICLITGANSGIGKAAAVELALKGFHVLIGCRNEERGLSALHEIKEKSHSSDVDLLLIDMSLQESIRKAADLFLSKYNRLDVLIHNAAEFDLTMKSPAFSSENIETVWATNHIGPVLLTQLLLERLKETGQARIITVSSKGLMVYPFLKVNEKDPEFRNCKYSVQKAYYQSKLAQVMYTYWLAEKLKGTNVTVNCIRVTNVKIDIDRYPGIPKILKSIYSMKTKFSITPEQMARTYTWLAESGDLKSVTGKYFDEKNRIVSSSHYSRNPLRQDEVMNLTLQYIK